MQIAGNEVAQTHAHQVAAGGDADAVGLSVGGDHGGFHVAEALDSVGVPAAALREHFKSIKGVRDAKVTKLLAMKRPAMFPVIDSRVVTLYKVAAAQKVGVSYPTTAAIREDVLAKATVTALAKLRSALLKNGSPKALRLAQLTGLRLRDVVLWQHWELVDKPPPAPAWPKRVAW